MKKIIIVSHDRDTLEKFPNDIRLMKNGALKPYNGTPLQLYEFIKIVKKIKYLGYGTILWIIVFMIDYMITLFQINKSGVVTNITTKFTLTFQTIIFYLVFIVVWFLICYFISLIKKAKNKNGNNKIITILYNFNFTCTGCSRLTMYLRIKNYQYRKILFDTKFLI